MNIPPPEVSRAIQAARDAAQAPAAPVFYVVHDDSGRILRSGICAPGDVELQGEKVLQTTGFVSDATHYVDGGLVEMPARPGEFHDFDIPSKTWVLNQDRAWAAVRAQRNAMLADSDWTDTVSAQARLDSKTTEAWDAYRQALRDITQQPDPLAIEWPAAP